MSQRGLKRFLDEMSKDPALAAAFSEAVAGVATGHGFDVTAADVGRNMRTHFQPSAEPAPAPKTDFSKLQPVATTLAVGEEEPKGKRAPSVTLAIGEEDKKPQPPKDEPRITTMAMGEEDSKGKRNPIITEAAGEEEWGDDRHRGATTLAVGEEDDKGRPSVTLAIGEEDKKKPVATTLAVGEEDKKKPSGPKP